MKIKMASVLLAAGLAVMAPTVSHAGDESDPVSYTPLTLPTSDLV